MTKPNRLKTNDRPDIIKPNKSLQASSRTQPIQSSRVMGNQPRHPKKLGTRPQVSQRETDRKIAAFSREKETQITLTLRRLEFNGIRRVAKFLRATPEEVLTVLITNENFAEYTNNCLHMMWMMDNLNVNACQ